MLYCVLLTENKYSIVRNSIFQEDNNNQNQGVNKDAKKTKGHLHQQL